MLSAIVAGLWFVLHKAAIYIQGLGSDAAKAFITTAVAALISLIALVIVKAQKQEFETRNNVAIVHK